MIIILLLAAVVSAVMAYVEKTGEYIDSLIIIAIVVFNACMGLIQESKAEKSLEALSKMAAPVAKVRRDGKVKEIPSVEVVPGDIILLETGNFVPADARILKAFSLRVEESALTGETVPVNKSDIGLSSKDMLAADMTNMVFATTTVSAGHGEAIVCETGMKTRVGQIAKLILADEAPETPLQRKLRRSRKKTRTHFTWNLLFNFRDRNCKTNTSNPNVYDINWTSRCCNSRRITCHRNHFIIHRGY